MENMEQKTDKIACITEKLDHHFFGCLDRTVLPAEYAAAIRKKDKETALKVAVDYFRNRPASSYFADLDDRSFDPETAERAVRGNITEVNIPYQFPGGRIDFIMIPPHRPVSTIRNGNGSSTGCISGTIWHWLTGTDRMKKQFLHLPGSCMTGLSMFPVLRPGGMIAAVRGVPSKQDCVSWEAGRWLLKFSGSLPLSLIQLWHSCWHPCTNRHFML